MCEKGKLEIVETVDVVTDAVSHADSSSVDQGDAGRPGEMDRLGLKETIGGRLDIGGISGSGWYPGEAGSSS